MSDRLESFIKKNRRELDEFEPPADLWNKIEKKLDEQKASAKKNKVVRLSFVLSIAASLLIAITAGILFFNYQKKEAADISNISPGLAKQQVHYASMIETKRNELKQIEKENPQLYSEFSSEIKKMELNYQRLKSDLPTSPNQEETVKAMIRNLQSQIQVLNQQLSIIQQINQIKQEQKNDTHSI
ncbi:hypothetical protein GS399_03235 [Pedobacter sp. HMF7647]|uniref:Anti-sigma factor n=1 Tax=Hufsiella arboris TaxID=2695275 RepID=A0A7K1Y5W7_9SPHI|nr:hypothetical protein [Hufsiella arboris]MXV49972.1 hypothetical protein [Hufsiella arboris]